ncbi:MAG: polyprenol monophosphomannose synthase [Chloroflexi bacterium]|nr:polyprenol monophosphomannose synthase [Chloroflexota bacterium]MCL5110833.1 polyprenol monophosphomannose synthase [Chloroflexota bacterium]
MSTSLVVVPTYNEAGNLPELVRRLAAVGPYDLLIVDDGSPDGTAAVGQRLAAEYPGQLAVLRRNAKEGLGPAYVAGFRWALSHGYDFIFQMDADLSHDPVTLGRLRAALDGADLVVGSRYVPGGFTIGWPRRRRLLSQLGSLYARQLLGVPVRDVTGGFKGFRRRALASLDLERLGARGFGFQVEVTYRLHRNGYRVVEVPITFADRQVGVSKMSSAIIAEALLLPWQLLLGDWLDHVRGVRPWGEQLGN